MRSVRALNKKAMAPRQRGWRPHLRSPATPFFQRFVGLHEATGNPPSPILQAIDPTYQENAFLKEHETAHPDRDDIVIHDCAPLQPSVLTRDAHGLPARLDG